MQPFKKLVSVFVLSSSVLAAPMSSAALPWFDSQGQKLPTLAPMIAEVNPAVVNISTFSTRKQAVNPLLNDPFFQHFFNLPQQRQPLAQKRQQSAGSGVIVDADNGIIISNHHVIKDADEIKIALNDGRSYDATLIGSDAELDIAVLKINADDLVDVELADSDALLVGDFVVAIGNPFGLGQTVTTGIVSALGRSGLGIEGYENFIQTDASINPGNSGGALVNLHGELVGINTAIIAPAGGNVGIGFAIPINMVKSSMDQLLEYGEVKRGQLGVGIQDIHQDLREVLALDNGQQGVLINEVFADSAADKAGLKTGDILVAVNDVQVKSSAQLRSLIAIRGVGEKVTLTLIRDGKEKTVSATIGEATLLSSNEPLHPMLAGVKFANFNGNSAVQGVEVTAIEAQSAGARSGLGVGDRITAVNKFTVKNMADFEQRVRASKGALLLLVNRGNRSFYLVINN